MDSRAIDREEFAKRIAALEKHDTLGDASEEVDISANAMRTWAVRWYPKYNEKFGRERNGVRIARRANGRHAVITALEQALHTLDDPGIRGRTAADNIVRRKIVAARMDIIHAIRLIDPNWEA